MELELKPIATAPKAFREFSSFEGEDILAYNDQSKEFKVVHWSVAYPISKGGWIYGWEYGFEGDDDGVGAPLQFHPTHWAPLPKKSEIKFAK